MEAIERCKVAFCEAMDDDFNTSVAIAELQRLKSDVNKLLSQGLSTEARKIARSEFRSLGNNLGLLQLDKWQFNEIVGTGALEAQAATVRGAGMVLTPATGALQISGATPSLINEEIINGKLVERNEARNQKDFKKADEIRQFLASHGIVIEDKPDGTSRWKR
jgi:cysteinyl-tRNA synthetase